MVKIKEFDNKEDQLRWIKDNCTSLIAQKKAQLKTADAFSYVAPLFDTKTESFKANVSIADYKSLSEIKVKAIINTTNVIDSHMDLHVKGIWNKSVKENKAIMHLQEHKMAFDSIISDGSDLKAYVENTTWKNLGYNFEGETQALVFESTVKADRNSKMFEQYAKGYVKNHSVGMQYVKMLLAVDSEDEYFKEEKKNFDKYIDLAINKEVAEQYGYFWVVLEAKAIEGSAVPMGSNQFTPTQNNNIEPGNKSTQQEEPSKDTLVLSKLNELLTKI